jgi:hypothetical protein
MQWRGKYASVTIEELLGNGVFVGSAPRLYNEDPRPAEIELRETVDKAAEDDSERVARKELVGDFQDFMCAVLTVRLINPLP